MNMQRTSRGNATSSLLGLIFMLTASAAFGSDAVTLERMGVAAPTSERAKFSLEIEPVSEDSERHVLFVGFFTAEDDDEMEIRLRAFRDVGDDVDMFGEDAKRAGEDSMMMVPRSTLGDVTVTIDHSEHASGGYEIVVTNQSDTKREIDITERLRGQWTHATDHNSSGVDTTRLELPDWGEARILIEAEPAS
ncbi:hypothetical protein [Aquisalimonas sp.]|uniref:hypothetical protein n=1 Tax=Aquisalimonas sp. TaxID=1872621 RepID=UPI0025C44473|nr:hypothetical protein [Aquisalimonas sp.]